MPTPSLPNAFIVIPIVLAMIFVVIAILKPELLKNTGGKIFGFMALFILPVAVGSMGGAIHNDNAQTTNYCLSCHIMDSWGRSLHVDDNEFVPAAHFQNLQVSRDKSCYVCHSDYAWYGSITAKIRGMQHVYVQYIGTMPDPMDIELYSPYNNRECLQCHQGARSYYESRHHRKDAEMLGKINNNEISCMESKCHDVQHNIDELDDYDEDEYWKDETWQEAAD